MPMALRAIGKFALALLLAHAPLAWAADAPKLDPANTAWMITATVLAVFFVPIFYLVVQGFIEMLNGPPKKPGEPEADGEHGDGDERDAPRRQLRPDAAGARRHRQCACA